MLPIIPDFSSFSFLKHFKNVVHNFIQKYKESWNVGNKKSSVMTSTGQLFNSKILSQFTHDVPTVWKFKTFPTNQIFCEINSIYHFNKWRIHNVEISGFSYHSDFKWYQFTILEKLQVIKLPLFQF